MARKCKLHANGNDSITQHVNKSTVTELRLNNAAKRTTSRPQGSNYYKPYRNPLLP